MALPLRAQEQGPCQGPLSSSSPSAPALAKFTPAAERSGIVFHGWVDAIRTPPRAHLVIENTNPYPVAVRFEAELRGGSGPLATGSRCVWIRAREFALDRPGVTVFDYPGTTLSQVRIAAAEITPLERPRPAIVVTPPPVPSPRAEAVVPPRGRAPARDTLRRRSTQAPPETVHVTVPLKMAQADTLPAADRSAAPARAEAVRAAPPPRPIVRPPPPVPQKPPPLARAANRTLRVAAAMILVPAGVILGIAVASAVTLLGGIVPLGMLWRKGLEKNVTPLSHENAEARR
ncbi:MAG TPA: hypothetical protein VF613_22115 [Longimicrobium sp.]|jgi:hypothetical protein